VADFFICWEVPLNAGTLTRDQQNSRPSDCKFFPLKTSFLYATYIFTIVTNNNNNSDSNLRWSPKHQFITEFAFYVTTRIRIISTFEINFSGYGSIYAQRHPYLMTRKNETKHPIYIGISVIEYSINKSSRSTCHYEVGLVTVRSSMPNFTDMGEEMRTS